MRILSTLFLFFALPKNGRGQLESTRLNDFVSLFKDCRRSDREYFDECMKNALNSARVFFQFPGIPELNLGPFDPFYAEEVVQRRGGPTASYKLTLRDVYERGWTVSEVTKFKSDLTNGYIRYHQLFPEKYLQGDWEIKSNFVTPFSNFGTFDLSLFNYTQVTTIRAIGPGNPNPENPFSVRIEAIDCGDLKLHISNLLKGRSAMEAILDRIINATWRPGFRLLKPLIDDLVSTAFTKIFNDNFRDFPFDDVIPSWKLETMPIQGHRSECCQRLGHNVAGSHDRETSYCPNHRFGCMASGSSSELEKHEAVCYHRWIRCCWYLQCGRREIRLSEYRKHLEDVHRPYIKKIGLNEEDEIVLKTDSMVRMNNIIRIEGTSAYFIRRCLLDLHEDVFLICVHYIGEADEAKNYIYRVRIDQGLHHAKYTCTSYCLPYVENSGSCVTSPNCTALYPSRLFLTKTCPREIHYSVTIKQI